MAKSNLYTRTGDRGETSLVGGERVSKCGLRLESYGTLDEFSSALGVLGATPGVPEDVRREIEAVQNELFNIGCYLATAVKPGETPACRSDLERRTEEVEGWIDHLDAATPAIHAFILPGGCQAAAAAHLARTICRRGERAILALAEEEYVDPRVTAYVNRLSDWLFILARYLNHLNGVKELVWEKEGRNWK